MQKYLMQLGSITVINGDNGIQVRSAHAAMTTISSCCVAVDSSVAATRLLSYICQLGLVSFSRCVSSWLLVVYAYFQLYSQSVMTHLDLLFTHRFVVCLTDLLFKRYFKCV